MTLDITDLYDDESQNSLDDYEMNMKDNKSCGTLESMTVVEISHPNYSQAKFNRRYGYKDIEKVPG
jgi:hypothetical protein